MTNEKRKPFLKKGKRWSIFYCLNKKKLEIYNIYLDAGRGSKEDSKRA